MDEKEAEVTTLVTGATGNVGRHVVRELVAAGEPVRALTRDPARARFPAGVQVVRGDLGRPEGLRKALRGVERLHMITLHDGETAAASRSFAEIAAEAGVRRAAVVPGGGEEHVIDAIRAAGIECAHIEPWEYMVNTLWWADTIRAEGVVREPFPWFRSSMVHEADIAAVAAAALLREGHEDRVYQVTGPEAITREQAVRTIGEVLGREIRFVELTREQAREEWAAAGTPPEAADWLLDVREDGEGMDLVTSDVEELTGRPARGYARWVADHADDFR